MNIIIILCSKKLCALIPFLNMTCIHSMIVFQNSTEAMIEARKASNKRVHHWSWILNDILFCMDVIQ